MTKCKHASLEYVFGAFFSTAVFPQLKKKKKSFSAPQLITQVVLNMPTKFGRSYVA